jgi:purine-cytosine permease-like protein
MEPFNIAASVCAACFVSMCVLGARDYDIFPSARVQKAAMRAAIIGVLVSGVFMIVLGLGPERIVRPPFGD